MNLKIDNKEVNLELIQATTFMQRFKGLQFRRNINYMLQIEPCNSIHMFGMFEALDVIFYDKNNNIIALYPNIKPYRISKIHRNALGVIEMPVGSISKYNIELNQTLARGES